MSNARQRELFMALGAAAFHAAAFAPIVERERLRARGDWWLEMSKTPDAELPNALRGLKLLNASPDRPRAEVADLSKSTDFVSVAASSTGIAMVHIRGELLEVGHVRPAIEKARAVWLDIDSPGGCSVAAGELLAMLDGKLCKVRIRRAGSAAALLAICTPGRRVIHPDGSIMLHALSTALVGSPAELRVAADFLERQERPWIERIARRTGRPEAEVAQWLSGSMDVWFTPEQALDRGLVDEISDE